jgi:hypothetical protein
LLSAIASSTVAKPITYRIGANVSRWTHGHSLRAPAMIAGSTQKPGPGSTRPPQTSVPPDLVASLMAAS